MFQSSTAQRGPSQRSPWRRSTASSPSVCVSAVCLPISGYGSSGPFRQALSERGLLWAVGLSRRQNVYPADIALIFPIAKTGKPRKYHIPDQPPVSAEALLAEGKWQRVSWRRGTKGRLTCLFTARRVCVADGHKHRMLNNRMQCMPGDEVWLVGERRSTGEQKYYVSNLPADATIKTLAATIKARWVCEQAHQQLKEELGLDHFEGRSWTGLHRHALMTMIAYAFLQSRRLKAAGRKKKNSQDRHHNQACRPSGKRSSISSHDLHPDNVLTVTGSLRISPSLKCHVWTAPAVQEESDISAKRSGAAMYPAFECSRYGRWP